MKTDLLENNDVASPQLHESARTLPRATTQNFNLSIIGGSCRPEMRFMMDAFEGLICGDRERMSKSIFRGQTRLQAPKTNPHDE